MTVVATYNPDLGRVQITADGLAAADYATVERSLNQITWVTVRGAGEVPVTGGVMDLTIDDYEFSDSEINYYRVRGISTDPITYVANGGGHSNANAAGTGTVFPNLPAGIIVGDLLVGYVSARNTAARVVVPSGWTMMYEAENVAFVGRRYVAGDTAPTWSWTGDVANATLLGIITAWRNAELAPVTAASQANVSAVNMAYPGLTIPADDLAVIVAAWRQDDISSVDTIAGMAEIVEMWDTAGDDAAQVADYVVQTTAANIPAGSFVTFGGAAAVSRGTVLALEHAEFLNEQFTSITPALSGDCGDSAVWLKSIARPFLNRVVQVVHRDPDSVTRPARTGVFDVIGRTMPVAVNDIRKSRRWTMMVRTESETEADLVDLLLASGDVLLIQVPAGCDALIPAGYVSVGDVTHEWHPLRPASKLWTLPVVEVAVPGPDVVGATITWAGVLALYDSWADLVVAHSSWASVLTLIGDPSEVIVA